MNSDSDSVSCSLDEFRSLLTHLNSSIPEDLEEIDENVYYLRFLRAKNMVPASAIQTYKRYHEMRMKNKDLFCKMTPYSLKHVLETGVVTKLPGTDNEGRAIFLFRFKMWSTKETSMDEVYLACVLLLEEISCIEDFQQRGVVMIHDYEGFEFSHFRQMTMRNFIRILQIMQGNFPLKFKAFHEINQPALFYILYKVFYPLVSYKLRKRIFMHGTAIEALAQHFPLSSLPTTLGGTSEVVTDENFMISLFQRESYYEKLALSLNESPSSTILL